jgi:hypothetical protein
MTELGMRFKFPDIDTDEKFDVFWLAKYETKIYIFIFINGVGLAILLFPYI